METKAAYTYLDEYVRDNISIHARQREVCLSSGRGRASSGATFPMEELLKKSLRPVLSCVPCLETRPMTLLSGPDAR